MTRASEAAFAEADADDATLLATLELLDASADMLAEFETAELDCASLRDPPHPGKRSEAAAKAVAPATLKNVRLVITMMSSLSRIRRVRLE